MTIIAVGLAPARFNGLSTAAETVVHALKETKCALQIKCRLRGCYFLIEAWHPVFSMKKSWLRQLNAIMINVKLKRMNRLPLFSCPENARVEKACTPLINDLA